MILAYFDSQTLLQSIAGMLLSILLLSWLLKRFRQPYFVAYILAGILLGPHCLKLFTDVHTIAQIGSLGLIIQMFFIGAEIEVPSLIKNIKTLTIGTAVQLLLSMAFILLVGSQLEWSSAKIVLFGFIVSLSSSAIILEYLHKNKEIHTRLGTITTGILILQDFLIVPMIMVLNFLGKGESDPSALIIGSIVTILFVLFLRNVVLKKSIRLPFAADFQPDHELQVFIGLSLCFGFAWITSLLHLSAALGAMFAGMTISQTRSTRWLDRSLVPFRIFFLSLFFFSVGLQIDVHFVSDNFSLIMTLVLSILLINSGINTLVFRLLRETWKNSVYAGALLSQIGEFSLILCIVAKELKLVDDFSFQLTLAVISITMLLTSAWIGIIRAFLFRGPGEATATDVAEENLHAKL
ncbi:cation:proton antiporter [Fulvivirgaceae bacterium PWU4]|uniref:Cation:proton antiporter n=1 Tax=Chryseosolibacter histidini TaxID=2782349 RepID=A0AAP2GMQ5_9BACT|nr:cation:proton antiporter [Chryseosolibacter histidini]MBT1697223.1 cation:proton antiporter [Chryseosolibacter histidini]